MHTRIKICCMASLAEARLAISHGADAVGLVGPMPSGPGTIDLATARQIAGQLPPPVDTFLLTSKTTAEQIAQEVDAVGPTVVQVVNHIAPAELEALAKLRPSLRIVQVVHVEGPQSIELAVDYGAVAHAILLDSGRPSASTPELGGTGRVHDWSLSREIVARCPKPVFLAGGLGPHNVALAIAQVKPHGVDLCSGVRTRGSLDPQLLGAFMAEVARADGR